MLNLHEVQSTRVLADGLDQDLSILFYGRNFLKCSKKVREGAVIISSNYIPIFTEAKCVADYEMQTSLNFA